MSRLRCKATHALIVIQFITWCVYLFHVPRINQKYDNVNPTEEPDVQVNPLGVSRWWALSRLDGEKYGYEKSNNARCSKKSVDVTNLTHFTLRSFNFSGSNFFKFSLNVDILEKICNFKQGYSIIEGSYMNRDFDVLVNIPDLCSTQDVKIELLILVKSAVEHFGRRRAIRKYWGNEDCWKTHKIKRVFLLGAARNETERKQISKESQTYGDLLQQAFVDNYYNNTLKVLFGIQWALSYCPNHKWLLFIDDDMFLNARNMISLLQSFNHAQHNKLLFGQQLTYSWVFRHDTKWIISKEFYSDSHYPNYVTGAFVLIGQKLLLDLYIASRFTRIIPFDDVYFGVLLNRILAIPIHIRGLYFDDPLAMKKSDARKEIAMHNVRSIYRHRRFWHLFNLTKMCSEEVA